MFVFPAAAAAFDELDGRFRTGHIYEPFVVDAHAYLDGFFGELTDRDEHFELLVPTLKPDQRIEGVPLLKMLKHRRTCLAILHFHQRAEKRSPFGRSFSVWMNVVTDRCIKHISRLFRFFAEFFNKLADFLRIGSGWRFGLFGRNFYGWRSDIQSFELEDIPMMRR